MPVNVSAAGAPARAFPQLGIVLDLQSNRALDLVGVALHDDDLEARRLPLRTAGLFGLRLPRQFGGPDWGS